MTMGNKGFTLVQLEKYDEAEKLLTECLQTEPKQLKARSRRAEL